jgi:hypothetical protein
MRLLGSAFVAVSVAVSAVGAAGVAIAHADFGVPSAGMACPASTQGVMTMLPNGTDFLVCQSDGSGYSWAPVAVPFPPNDAWLSYGVEITLHGEGFRNPELRSGEWVGVPHSPDAQCAANQVTVIGPGQLAAPSVSQGAVGRPLALRVLPKLFTIALNGDCLWTRTSG